MEPAPPDPALVRRFRRDLAALDPQAGEAGPVGVAVSGGPDSLALLLLAAAALPGRVRAATVDHRLRAESAAEAAIAAGAARALLVPHRILPVEVARAGEGLQAAARAARYAALAGWADAQGAALVLTAHHADDQAETLLMRLLRGAGVAGLAGIRALAPLPVPGAAARLGRPLLGWRRSELEGIVRAAGLEAAADPSNANEAYDRARLRRRLAALPWIEAPPLARSAAALAEAEDALDWAAARLFEARAVAADGTLALDPAGLPAELLRRVVLRALRAIEPEAAPRGAALAGLLARLAAGGTATLAGVRCAGGATYLFARAPPRAPR
ncbi:MAG: tRNA lysidine(34) synthetase TilS [Alphaproteobacteria bacterium]|nr:tRNA lysidine(34) synthetase TilS [Alphaproteobacteria bacterium]MBV9372394.1 tRNA lysidine(34) synthetase TilS [Alphaproteobacteria bacterium]MBV9901380.1 tRNA lysidine(34) synthetase TilS [Alphaproteobacteria bacterium]